MLKSKEITRSDISIIINEYGFKRLFETKLMEVKAKVIRLERFEYLFELKNIYWDLEDKEIQEVVQVLNIFKDNKVPYQFIMVESSLDYVIDEHRNPGLNNYHEIRKVIGI